MQVVKRKANKSGRITLYNHTNNMMVTVRYFTPEHRKNIIDRWAKFYQDKYKNFFYQIAPDLRPEKQKELV
jgi:hypothetical protein